MPCPTNSPPHKRKARRAAPPAGKAVTRLSGLRNDTPAIGIDRSHAPGPAPLPGEAASEYLDMVAKYHRTFAPANRVEVGIVQRLIDAQWRLLRNARLLSFDMETCLDGTREQNYPGLPPAAAEMDLVVANRMGDDAKYTRPLYREEAALVRLINATHRERNSVRKLNPSPAPPVLPRLEYTGKKQSILDQALAVEESSEQPPTVEKTEETAPGAHGRSQPAATSKTFAASAAVRLYGDLDPV